MRRVVIAPTFEGWRAGARRMLAAGVEPRAVVWAEEGEEQEALTDLLAVEESVSSRPVEPTHRVPRAFFSAAELVTLHADGERWGLLYRVLWRIVHGERALMEVAMDPDVHRLQAMAKAVRREAHKMKAFVRFRTVEGEDGTVYVAWFEPAHHVVEFTAPFFAERFASMRWSILTPRGCAHWDGKALAFTPGVPRSAAPSEDALEGLWRTYYGSIFNPGRIKPGAMRAEMPVRYWKNLPEAGLIAPLLRDAPARVRRMIEEQGKSGD